jgi:hypothetical protein
MKKLLIAAAGAATMFAVTTAGAATLSLAGPGSTSWFKHTVQQSDQVTASCADENVETGYNVSGENVDSLSVLQQDIQNCLGSEFQAVLYDASGERLIRSEIERYTTAGLDLVLDFAGNVDPQDVATMRLTIADNIS